MKRIQGVTHLKMKRVTNSKCVNIIVFWMPRPVKVGLSLPVSRRFVRDEKCFYTFYIFYNAIYQ